MTLVLGLALASCGRTHHQAVPPAAPTSPLPPTSPPRPPAPTTASQGTGSAASAASRYTWARDASPALAIGGGSSSTLAAVLPPNGRTPWTVAGTRLAAEGATTATVWTSADGISWRADALTGPQVDSQADAATSWHGGTVVVGSVGPASDRHAAVWISPGAGAPFVERTSPALLADDSEMTLLSSGPLGLVGAGTAQGRVAMWYSTDGRSWTRLSGAEQLIGAADDPHIDTLLATTDEGVFAAGWDHSGSSIQAALWSSGDGIHWRQVQQAGPQFGGPGDHLITGLAQLQSEPSVSGTGLVAVGGTWTGSRWTPSSWISPNGVSWSRPSTTFALGARPQADASDAIARAVIAIPSTGLSTTLLAVGGGPTAQRLWKSTDGLHWTELTLPSAAEASDQWQASLLAVAGSTTIVADGDPGRPQILVDRAGTGWAQPSANPLVFGAVQPVARPTGLVATATDVTMAVETDNPGQVIGPASPATELLSSVDGTNWSPVATGTVFGGATVTGLANAPGGLIAVGWRQTGNTDEGHGLVGSDRAALGTWHSARYRVTNRIGRRGRGVHQRPRSRGRRLGPVGQRHFGGASLDVEGRPALDSRPGVAPRAARRRRRHDGLQYHRGGDRRPYGRVRGLWNGGVAPDRGAAGVLVLGGRPVMDPPQR